MTTHLDDDRTTPPGRSPASPPTPTPARRRPGTVGARSVTSAPATRAAAAAGPRREPAADAGEPAAPGRPVAPRDHQGQPRLPWILAVIGLLGTVTFGLAWNHARTHEAAGSPTAATGQAHDVRAAAVAFSKALTNFDGATIDRDFDRLLGLSTGAFRDQADQFFSTKTRVALKDAQASSRGEVRQAFVQSLDDTRGTVFVVVDQTIANNKSPQPQADTLRMELTLKATKGTWLVDQVDVLTAPGAGSALPGTGTSGSGAGH